MTEQSFSKGADPLDLPVKKNRVRGFLADDETRRIVVSSINGKGALVIADMRIDAEATRYEFSMDLVQADVAGLLSLCEMVEGSFSYQAQPAIDSQGSLAGDEIERKFLVSESLDLSAYPSSRICQGYLSSAPERTVRIRIQGAVGILTVKGPGNDSGARRYEWEAEVSLYDAERLMELCEPGVIDKTRHLIEVGEHVFEVDVFHGENQGLVLAEIELDDEDEVFIRPDWLRVEVTRDKRYYNSSLIKRPFSTWN